LEATVDGKTRLLGIPTVKDRIVQTAVKLVLEPIFEATFCPTSYGFRPGRGYRDALREVDHLIKEGHTYVVDADLQSYLDPVSYCPYGQNIGPGLPRATHAISCW
jgi:RNA-directed DNA polymerase